MNPPGGFWALEPEVVRSSDRMGRQLSKPKEVANFIIEAAKSLSATLTATAN